MKQLLVLEGRVMYRNAKTAELKVAYKGEEITVPDAVFERNRRNVQVLKEWPDPVEPVGTPPKIADTMMKSTSVEVRQNMQRQNVKDFRASPRDKQASARLKGGGYTDRTPATKKEIEARQRHQADMRRAAKQDRLIRQQRLAEGKPRHTRSA